MAGDHGAAGAGHGGSGLQGFIDSEHGALFAVLLHWIGALSFLAGVLFLAIFLARRRRDPELAETAPVLPGLLIVGGILINLTGGVMRLWVSGHPTLDHLATSTWVQALFAKHMGLVVGMSASLVMLAAATPSVARRARLLAAAVTPKGTEALTALAFLGVVMATIIGALVTTVVVPEEDAMAAQAFPALAAEDLSARHTDFLNSTGAVTGTPLQAGESRQDVAVPAGATEMRVRLQWQSAAAALRLELRDPDGAAADASPQASGTSIEATLAAPRPGLWTVAVASDRAASEPFTLAIATDVEQRFTSRYEQTIDLAAGAEVEVELELPAEGRFRYDYYLAAGDEVAFQVHRDEPFQVAAEASEPTGSGTVAAAEGGHYGIVLSSPDGARAALRLVGAFAILSAPGAAAEMMEAGHAHG